MGGFLARRELVLSLVAMVGIFGCSKKAADQEDVLKNYTTVNSELPRAIGDAKYTFNIRAVEQNGLSTLLIDYPLDLVSQENIFGGTVTEISDSQDAELGGLKMASLDPLHVKTRWVSDQNGDQFLWLDGCVKDCTDRSERHTVARIPVVTANLETRILTLDLSKLGASLNIFNIDGRPLPDAWTLISTQTRSVDYSLTTLVFDVVSTYTVPAGETTKEFSLTVRWYLRLGSLGTPFFETRAPIPEVGYFGTGRNAHRFIQRFRTVTDRTAPIKYYIKNVPAEYQRDFADGFEAWNEKMLPLFKAKFVTYEFLDATDPRAQAIVTGDIRYNVLEWDLLNVASYGGLGPAIVDQRTGEVIAAQVLIQGPLIERLYKGWFASTNRQQFTELVRALIARTDNKASGLRLRFGDLEAKVPALDPHLQDSRNRELRMDFDTPPEGYTYTTYMRGYWRDMVAHELGHNFGLAHNFRGSFGSDTVRTVQVKL